MKKFIAIGHFKESENITSVAEEQVSREAFMDDLKGNAFTAWAVIGERKMKALKESLSDDNKLLEEIKKLTGNYRVWNELLDYVGQCWDIVESKLANCN